MRGTGERMGVGDTGVTQSCDTSAAVTTPPPIRRVKISGGPHVTTLHVTDAETGQEIYVRSFEILPVKWSGGVRPPQLTVKLEVAAELNLLAEEAVDAVRGHDVSGGVLPTVTSATSAGGEGTAR